MAYWIYGNFGFKRTAFMLVDTIIIYVLQMCSARETPDHMASVSQKLQKRPLSAMTPNLLFQYLFQQQKLLLRQAQILCLLLSNPLRRRFTR